MKSVDRLIGEHRLIERMLRVLDDCAQVLDRGGDVPPGMPVGILDFLQRYADQGHHAKEEDLFFPALADHGLPADASAVYALRAQHEGGRGLVRELREALRGVERGEDESRRAFAATAADYISLLREHIRLEDHYFPEYAEACFKPADDEALLARMDAEDRDRGIDRTSYEHIVAGYEEALLKC